MFKIVLFSLAVVLLSQQSGLAQSGIKIGQTVKNPTGFEADIMNDPNNYKLYNSRGKELLTNRQYMKALSYFKQSIQINPKYADAYSNAGAVYIYMRRYDLALENLNKAIELDPKLFGAYRNRAMYYKAKSDNANMCQDYKTACKLGDCYELKEELGSPDCK